MRDQVVPLARGVPLLASSLGVSTTSILKRIENRTCAAVRLGEPGRRCGRVLILVGDEHPLRPWARGRRSPDGDGRDTLARAFLGYEHDLVPLADVAAALGVDKRLLRVTPGLPVERLSGWTWCPRQPLVRWLWALRRPARWER